MKERWSLINSGIDRKSIKVRGTNLFVSGKLFGKVSELKFVPTTQSSTNSISNTVLPASTQPVMVKETLPSAPTTIVPPVCIAANHGATSSNVAAPAITLESADPSMALNRPSRPSTINASVFYEHSPSSQPLPEEKRD